MANSLFSYLYRGLMISGHQLLALLAFPLLLALGMHYLARLLQNRGMHLIGEKPFLYLTAPGTAIHELSHAIFCLVFFHKIKSITLFQMGKDNLLGCVVHTYNPRNPWHQVGNFFIATGPIWLGCAALYGLLLLMGWSNALVDVRPWGAWLTSLGKSAWALPFHDWQLYVGLYLFLCVGSHVTLSPPDLRAAWGGAVAVVLAWIFINWATLWAAWDLTQHAVTWLLPWIHKGCLAMLVALVLELVLLLVVSLLGLVRR